MIFAQINPVASITQQTTPFVQTTVTGSYMTAIARPYALGSEKVNFQVNYGNVTFDESGSVISKSSASMCTYVFLILSRKSLLSVSEDSSI